MKVIGVTGGIGCGKSKTIRTALKMSHGLHINTDDIAKELMQKGNVAYCLVAQYFGECILNEDGSIDNKKLAAIVFSDKKELEKLNSLVHPCVVERVRELIENERKDDSYDYVFLESALLFDTDLWKMCDETWNISARYEVRIQRLVKFRHYSAEEAEAFIRNQKSEKEYKEKSTRTIQNNDLKSLKSTMEKILKR